MAIDTTVDKRRRLVIRVAHGEINAEQVLASIQETLNHPDYGPGFKSLTDLRGIKASGNVDDVKAVGRMIVEQGPKLTGGRAAVVVSDMLSYGMMRMLQGYTGKSPLEIRVFYDIDEAKDWLDVDEIIDEI